MAYALVRSSTLANLTAQATHEFNIGLFRNLRNVTTGAATGTATTHVGGRYSPVMQGYGSHYVSSAYVAPVGLAVSNGPGACMVACELTQSIHVDDVSCPNDAISTRRFVQGRHTYSGRGTIALATTETPLESGTVSLTDFTIPFGTGHSVVADAELSFEQYRQDYTTGGQLWLGFSFTLTGEVTINGTLPFSNTSYTFDAQLNNGQYWDGTAIVRSQSARVDYRSALPAQFNFDLLVSGTYDADSSDGG